MRIVFTACLLLPLATSCTEKRSAAPALAPSSAPPAAVSEEKAGKDRPDQSAKQIVIPGRKVIRDGEISIQIKSYGPARQAIEALVQKLGGYISGSRVDHGDQDSATAEIALRVPADRFDEALASLARLGAVLQESTRASDITEQYYDVKARLANAKRVESRLVELAKQTGKVSDLLEVEREMARVREQIELFEGKMHLFDNQVELSTIVVHLYMREKGLVNAPTFGEDARDTITQSWRALRGFARGLVLVGVALLPWAPLIVLLVWLLFRWRARRRARRQATTR
jgi:hypothetical protein